MTTVSSTPLGTGSNTGRPPGRSIRGLDPWALAGAALIVVTATIMLYTFLDYGLTYDEENQHIYAKHVWQWYLTAGQQRDALTYKNLMYYGAFFEMLAELGGRWLPWGIYEGRHFVNVLCALLGAMGVYYLGRLVDTPRAGFFSGLLLLATPEYYGHSFNNSKDIPLAVASVWAVLAILKGARQLPVRWCHVVWTGIALGLVLAVRVGAIFHFGYLALAWMGSLVIWHWNARTDSRDFIRDGGGLAGRFCVAIVVAWGTMLAFWPYAQVKPIENPLRAAAAAARFPWNNPVRFEGLDVLAMELPRTYLPVQLAIRLPEFFYIALACGVLVLLASLRPRRSLPLGARAIDVSILLLAVVFPIGSAVMLRTTLYDGMRHFIFVLPPLAVLAGVGFSRFLDLPLVRRVRFPVGAVIAVGICSVMLDMAALHPYQSVYFNRVLAGGLRGAAGRFETDYWGSSYREAAEWVFRNYRSSTGSRVTIRNCSADFLTRYVINSNPNWKSRFTIGPPNETPDVFLATERWHCHELKAGRLLHVVQRQGVPLAYVFEMTKPSAATLQ